MSQLESIRMPKLELLSPRRYTYSSDSSDTSQVRLRNLPKLHTFEVAPGGVRIESKGKLRPATFEVTNTSLSRVDRFSRDDTSRQGYDYYGPRETITSLIVADNPNLTSIALPEWRDGVGQLSIYDNGPNLTIAFANLQDTQNVTIRHAQKIELPSLVNITGHFDVTENQIESFELPLLTTVNGNFTLAGNEKLRDVKLPLLSSVGRGWGQYLQGNGNLSVHDNPRLLNLIGIAALKEISRRALFSGNFIL
jgi:hypothetical protein